MHLLQIKVMSRQIVKAPQSCFLTVNISEMLLAAQNKLSELACERSIAEEAQSVNADMALNTLHNFANARQLHESQGTMKVFRNRLQHRLTPSRKCDDSVCVSKQEWPSQFIIWYIMRPQQELDQGGYCLLWGLRTSCVQHSHQKRFSVCIKHKSLHIWNKNICFIVYKLF